MLKFLLPVLLAIVGIGAGVGAGLILKPAPSEEQAETKATAHDLGDCPPSDAENAPGQLIDAASLIDSEYVKLNNQFIIPIITDTRVAALVVMSATIEIKSGNTELVYSREPKLRDLFLQTFFDHASIGRFSGEFTNSSNLGPLREELLIVAKRVLGDAVTGVLLTEMVRQDS